MSVHVAWKQFKAIVHIRQTKKGCSEFTAKAWENNETALDGTASREYKPRAYHDRRSGNRRTSGLPSINIHILWQNFQDMFTMNLDWKLWCATGCWNYRICTGQRMAKILRDRENANNIIPHGGEKPYPSASTVSRQLVVMSLMLVKIVHFRHKPVSHEMTVRSSDWNQRVFVVMSFRSLFCFLFLANTPSFQICPELLRNLCLCRTQPSQFCG